MAETNFLTYKGKPLVRKGNEIYYGDMSEKYVIYMKVLNTVKDGEDDVAGKISIQLINTDPTVPVTERIVKKSEKVGLYKAMDIGAVWLERQLKNNK